MEPFLTRLRATVHVSSRTLYAISLLGRPLSPPRVMSRVSHSQLRPTNATLPPQLVAFNYYKGNIVERSPSRRGC